MPSISYKLSDLNNAWQHNITLQGRMEEDERLTRCFVCSQSRYGCHPAAQCKELIQLWWVFPSIGTDMVLFIFDVSFTHKHTQTQHKNVASPLTPAGLGLASCLLQLFREFLHTSLLRFLITPDDTLLIFSLLLFSQESDCSSFPVWWFMWTEEDLVRGGFGTVWNINGPTAVSAPKVCFFAQCLGCFTSLCLVLFQMVFGWRATTFPV